MSVIIPGPIHSEQQMPNDAQNYVMVTAPKPTQDGLIQASYIFSVLNLFFISIAFGIIGFILGLIAEKKGDSRGGKAMVFATVSTVFATIIFVYIAHDLGWI